METNTNVTKKDTIPEAMMKVGLGYYCFGVALMAVGCVAQVITESIDSKKAKTESKSE